ncbi:MAG: translation initiation factor IF-2 [Sedimentisphaerales bacterium]|nr:translation initiation factor IF-2 [Sedimentisphaerales bacterium]MBN2843065.1 translation initiation factor IF-2 [Sedimentisphaerales bacterium]
MANKRVHEIAKELGIKSKAIVDKCIAEGLPAIKGHQSTVSAGLEATIMEWFSQGCLEHNTVETAEKVNLEEVRVKKAGPVKSDSDKHDEQDSDAQVADAPQAEEQEQEKPQRLSPKELMEQEAADQAPVEPIAAGQQVAEEIAIPQAQPEPEVKAQELATPTKAAEPVVEQRRRVEDHSKRHVAEPVTHNPVIRRVTLGSTAKKVEVKAVEFTPAPARLSGPQVIRTERPDFVPVPRRKLRKDGMVEEPAVDLINGAIPPKAGDASSKVKGKKGNRKVTLNDDVSAIGKVAKKGKRVKGALGIDDAIDYRGRDLRERDERLAKASGMGVHRIEKQIRRSRGGSSSYNNYGGGSVKARIEKATVKEPITVKDLSAAIGVRATQIIGKLMGMGVMANINETISSQVAETLAIEFDVELVIEQTKTKFEELVDEFDTFYASVEKVSRPPVVAFLGHVDHGKTSLLDYIRKAHVTKGEAGGITQHIGSYLYDDGVRRVAFLDTPGHKAFTEMRARGANMTDIVVLVVAADDGIMPQTEEAIAHAKAAGVPIIVALNKIDMPTANPNMVYGQLAEHGLVPAEWGGDTEVIQTSAITGKGMDTLVEHLDMISELHDLKAAYDGAATGWVVEAEMSPQTGVIARLLVKEGTLKPGDIVVSGSACGRVRALNDATGVTLDKAGPATPVEITGLDEVPVAGDRFFVLDSMPRAVEIASELKQERRQKTLASRRQVTLDNLFAEIAAGDVKEFNVIVKADVQGSVDVLCKSITELNTPEVAVKVLHAAVGGISESDVLLAEASNAIIIGFQVVADDRAKTLAERSNVEIRHYRIIYKIVDDIRAALEGMLTPDIEIKVLGKVEVRQVFKISRLGSVAGCFVQEGVITRNAKVRVVRDSVIIRDENAIDTLRRGKDDASEVKAGLECGLKLVNFDDVKAGDIIEVYEEVKVSRSLDSK